jgi:PST family polysaccharide transporter
METKAIRGIPWAFLTAAGKLGPLATTIVLARLLVPSDFGLVTLGYLVVVSVGFFVDLGLSSSVVLRSAADRERDATAFAVMIGGGVVVALLTIAASPVVASVFDQPRLDAVLAVMAGSLVLSPVSWFYDAILQRELLFRSRFAVQLLQVLAYASTSIPFAVAGAGVWSIVAGQLTSAAAQAAAAFALSPYRVRPTLLRGHVREVLQAGYGFAAQGGLLFLRQNLDYYAVGFFLGAKQLGLYSVAYRLGEIPAGAVSEPVASVTFPAFARMRQRGEDIRRPYLSSFRSVALATGALGVVISGAAEPLVLTFLGHKWEGTIGPLTVFGLWAIVRSLESTVGWLLNSIGRTELVALTILVSLIPLLPALALAADHAGTTAVAVVMLADKVLSVAILLYYARRWAHVAWASHARALAPILLGAALGWPACFLVAESLEATSPALALGAAAVAGLLAYAAGVSAADRRALPAAGGQVLRALGRRPEAAEP